MSSRPPSRRALAALAAVGVACLVAASCSGDDGPGTTSTTVAPSSPELEYPRFSDASQPVAVPIGRRFALMLPADPANGWRWVVTQFNRDVLAPLGSEFEEDPALLAQATTTTTTSSPPDSTPPGTGAIEPGIEETTTTTTTAEAPTPTTTPGPLVQVISFAGKAPIPTTITLRYERIGAEAGDSEEIEFVVLIGGAQLPEVLPETTLPPP